MQTRKNNASPAGRSAAPGRANANSGRPQSQDRRRQAKKKPVSQIDPALLTKKAIATPRTQEEAPAPSVPFARLALPEILLQNVRRKGYEVLTPIQEQAIPALLEGQDVLALSRTGSGKTAAFLLPLITKLMKRPALRSALILTPTRELALQIEEEFKSLAVGTNLRVATFIGGTSLPQDLRKCQARQEVLIATPGRLLDLVNQQALKLDKVDTLILDEFDRMLDMGFVHDVRRIVTLVGTREQTVLFSATMDDSQRKIISSLLEKPVEIRIHHSGAANEQVDQETIQLREGEDKFLALQQLLGRSDMEKVILFTETKRLADRLTKKLVREGITAGQIHGDKSQNFRNNVLQKFKNGGIRVLVATDVAARGIDVQDVSHVINYQLPQTMDAYIHRVGRTGRAGKSGKAITFLDPKA